MDKRFLWFLILFLGIGIRFFFALGPSSGDMNNHIAWAQDMLANGSFGIYDRYFLDKYGTLDPNYPPLSLSLFTLMYWLHDISSQAVLWLNSQMALFPSGLVFWFQSINSLHFFMKLPAIIADILLVVVMIHFLKKSPFDSIHIVIASLILLNPAFIYNSAIWGQIDVLPLVPMVMAVFMVIRKQYVVSALALAVALLLKQTIVIFIPLYFLLLFFQTRQWLTWLKVTTAFLGFLYVGFIPFTSPPFEMYEPFQRLVVDVITQSGQTFITNHAFNVWWLITEGTNIEDTTVAIGPITYQHVGYGIGGILVLFILVRLGLTLSNYRQIPYYLQQVLVAFSASAIALVVFTIFPRMHERHLLLALPFMAALCVMNSRWLSIFWIVSLLHWINMYHNWFYPPLYGLKSVFGTPFSVYAISIGIISVAVTILYSFYKITARAIYTRQQ